MKTICLFGIVFFLFSCEFEDFSSYYPDQQNANLENRNELDPIQQLIKEEIYNLNMMAFEIPDDFTLISPAELSEMTYPELLSYLENTMGIDGVNFLHSLENVANYSLQTDQSGFLKAANEGSREAIYDYVNFMGFIPDDAVIPRATPCYDQYVADIAVANMALLAGFVTSVGTGIANPFAGSAGFIITGLSYFALVNQAEVTYRNCLRTNYPDVFHG